MFVLGDLWFIKLPYSMPVIKIKEQNFFPHKTRIKFGHQFRRQCHRCYTHQMILCYYLKQRCRTPWRNMRLNTLNFHQNTDIYQTHFLRQEHAIISRT